MPNNDLYPILNRIHETVGDVLGAVRTIREEVSGLHETVKNGVTELQNAIYENIKAQAEFKLMEHQMELRSINPQIEAEQDQIQAEREELEDRLDHIAQRYEEKHDDLDATAERRIRDLGEHIFQIDEDEYQDGIEDPLLDLVAPMWHELQTHNQDVREDRASRLADTASQLVADIESFVDRQAGLVREIDDHRVSLPDAPAEPTEIQVPYYVVTVEVDGVEEKTIVTPARQRQQSDDDWCRGRLNPFPGFDDVITGDTTNVGDTRAQQIPASEFRRELEQFSDAPTFGRSYVDGLEEAAAGSVIYAAEEGSR